MDQSTARVVAIDPYSEPDDMKIYIFTKTEKHTSTKYIPVTIEQLLNFIKPSNYAGLQLKDNVCMLIHGKTPSLTLFLCHHILRIFKANIFRIPYTLLKTYQRKQDYHLTERLAKLFTTKPELYFKLRDQEVLNLQLKQLVDLYVTIRNNRGDISERDLQLIINLIEKAIKNKIFLRGISQYQTKEKIFDITSMLELYIHNMLSKIDVYNLILKQLELDPVLSARLIAAVTDIKMFIRLNDFLDFCCINAQISKESYIFNTNIARPDNIKFLIGECIQNCLEKDTIQKCFVKNQIINTVEQRETAFISWLYKQWWDLEKTANGM